MAMNNNIMAKGMDAQSGIAVCECSIVGVLKFAHKGSIQSILKKNVINLDSFLISTTILPSMLSFQAKQHFVTFAFLKFK